MENKDRGFWEKLKEWDVMFLSETWLQRRGWERVRKWLSKRYMWEMQDADRRSKKREGDGENGHGNERRVRKKRGK